MLIKRKQPKELFLNVFKIILIALLAFIHTLSD